MQLSVVREVPLTKEVFGVSRVEAVFCEIQDIDIVMVHWDTTKMLSRVMQAILQRAIGGSGTEATNAAIDFAKYQWSQLHPDIGDGPRASLGKRRVHFKKLFTSISPSNSYKGFARGFDDLAQRGDGQSPTFMEWKAKVHFMHHVITAKDVNMASRFFTNYGTELTARYYARRSQKQWQVFPADDIMGREFNKRMRNDSQALAKKAELSLNARKAATLLAHRYLANLQNQQVEEIITHLPDGVLGKFSEQVFRWMWWSNPEGSDRFGRFDIPIMNSPVLAGAIEHVGVFDEAPRKHYRSDFVDELIRYAKARFDRRPVRRPNIVNIAIGFGEAYEFYAEEIRTQEREIKRQSRNPTGQSSDNSF